MKNPIETEVKIPVTNLSGIVQRLLGLNFHISAPREHEVNDIYDTPDQELRQKSMMLRLRSAGNESVLTWKGPGQPGPHKSRAELETTVDSLDTLRQIFEQLGYQQSFRYEKFRTEYTDGSEHQGVLTIDETPIGNFLEIEGPADWIDWTATHLGFSERDYIVKSYGELYLDHCRELGVAPSNMTFDSVPVN